MKRTIKKTKPRYELCIIPMGSISININVSRSQKLKEYFFRKKTVSMKSKIT
jgi:hypothetical protein